MSFGVEHLVQARIQEHLREAEQYRLAHPQRAPRPRRAPRHRPAWAHLPDVSGLLHRGRHTPRTLG